MLGMQMASASFLALDLALVSHEGGVFCRAIPKANFETHGGPLITRVSYRAMPFKSG